MRRVAAHLGDFVVRHRRDDAAADAAVAAGRSHLAPRLDHYEAVLHPRAVDRNAHLAVFDAAAAAQAEVLLVDRRGDDQLAFEVADDAAREDVRARERIEVAYGMDLLLDPEHRHLLPADE